MDSLTSFVPGVWAVCRMKNSRIALSLAVTPSSAIFHFRECESSMVAVPTLGASTLVITKSELTTSSITMLVAPTLVILAASSANRASSSASSGVTATWEALGLLAQVFSALISSPSEPIRPMQ